MARAIERISGPIVLVMGAGFGQLVWEVLADERGFLVDRGVVIVRSVFERGAVTIRSVAKPYQLNLLLMAAAPIGGGAALAFEAEEGRILAATKTAELQLVVEESGCLEELETLVTDYGAAENGGAHFDVFHLTGHATIAQGVPLFQLETETGDARLVTAREIAGAFGAGFPAVVFLSGCLSGKSGVEASMAAALVTAGAGAVLGWGQSVLDSDAIVAAEILYRELAAGQALAVAIGKTVSGMRAQGCRDWHLLRVFVGDRMPGSLVTGKMRRKAQKKMSFAQSEFLDVGTQTVKVASRRTFVGRRRVLQAGLRSLKWDSEKVGLWIHGMGGLGKSSVAARLCDRLGHFEQVVRIGMLDEAGLVNGMAGKVRSKTLRDRLFDSNDGLMYRLRDVLEVCDEKLLIVLDDFEFNFEGFDPVSSQVQTSRAALQLKTEAARVLRELEQAIALSGREHRVIVTCRYRLDGLESRYRVLPLAGMDAIELDKKRKQLAVMGLIKAAIDRKDPATVRRLTDWLGRVEAIADGNPRLLMWLDQVVCSGEVDEATVLAKLESTREAFRSDVLAELLLGMVSAKGKAVLVKGLVFRLAVPIEVFKSVCGEVEIDRSISLGLLEVMPEGTVRVSRVLPLVELEDEQLAMVAAREVYQVWYKEAETSTEEQKLEIHRLAMAAKDGEITGTIAGDLAGLWRGKRNLEALILCRSTIQISANLRMIIELGYLEDLCGNPQQAMTFYHQALEFCTEENAQPDAKASIFNQMALIYDNQGQVEKAIELYQQSLALNEEIGNVQGKASTLHNLAVIYEEQGQVEQAIDLYQQSLAISEKFGNVQDKATTLHSMATNYAKQGQVEQAIELFQQSLVIEEQIGSAEGKAVTLWWLGKLFTDDERDIAKGLVYLKEAREIYLHLKSPSAQVVQEIIGRIER